MRWDTLNDTPMRMKNIRPGLLAFCFLASLWLSGCRTAPAPDNAETAAAEGRKSVAPQRVDVRGYITMSRYNEGQVVLEVEGILTADTRYQRAYVLVLPTTQMVDATGNPISLSELVQGKQVAILLRAGGRGNLVGVGVARKLWLEEIL